MVLTQGRWRRGKSDSDDDNDEDEDDNDEDDDDYEHWIGIADYAAAGRGDSSTWVASGEGVILRCEGEYEFGRFAFDPAGDGEAHAFPYFRNFTNFAETGFLGRPPLRQDLTENATECTTQ